MDALVSTEWLAGHLGEPGLAVVDAAGTCRRADGAAGRNISAAHISGARFLDIDEVSDRANPAPHMLPSAEQFGRAMEATGHRQK